MSSDKLTADSDVFLKPCEICGEETTNSPLAASSVCEDCVDSRDIDELIVATDTQLVYSVDDQITCRRCGDIDLRSTFEAQADPCATRGVSIVDSHPDVLYLSCAGCDWPMQVLATPEVTDVVDDLEVSHVLGRRSR